MIENIAPSATIEFSPIDNGDLKQQGTVDQTTDGFIGDFNDGQFGWAIPATEEAHGTFYELGIDITYSFAGEKDVSSIVAFESVGTKWSEDDYMYSELIISTWSGSDWTQEGSIVHQDNTQNFEDENTIEINKKTSKVRARINIQTNCITFYNSGYLVWYFLKEFQIFASVNAFSVSVNPFGIVASLDDSSPVKMAVGENVYGFPLVETNTAFASPLRICMGENDIRAFKLA